MSEHLLEPEVHEANTRTTQRRQRHGAQERLVLSELAADAVIDRLDIDDSPVELITFGTVREACPSCHEAQLKLVLRQRRVRLAHLFCAGCQRCFDAHYANGASALTI